MFKNYIKIALRNLWKERTFTALNILGLTAAFAVAFILITFTIFELSHDQFHENGDSIYQVYTNEQTPQGTVSGVANPVPFAHALKEEVPGIAHITRFQSGSPSIIIDDKSFTASASWVDPSFFNIFTFPVVAGNANKLLTDKNDAVITEYAAKRFFGEENPIGKSFILQQEGEQVPVTVTAILKDFPDTSSLGFDVIFNFTNLPAGIYADNVDRWDNHNHEVYVQLKDGIDPKTFESSTSAFSALHYANDIANSKRDGAQADPNGNYRQIKLLPLTDINFTSISNGMIKVSKNLQYLILCIALLIIFIASVNFINMSIGKGTKRLKEIGMRKTLGANGRQLFFQFWGESMLVFISSIILAYGIALILLPSFQNLFRTKATFNVLTDPSVLLFMVLGFVIITLLAGGYPALLMSRLETLQALKGKVLNTGKNYLRDSLMVVQFSIAILLISGTLVLWNQLEFLRSKDLGFNKEQVISIPLKSSKDPEQLIKLLRDDLSSKPGIISITAADNILGMAKDNTRSRSVVGFEYEGREIKTDMLSVDYDYPETLDIPLVAGRTHNRNYTADSLSIVVNESMAAQFNVENPLDVVVDLDFAKFNVIGVIKDYNFQNLNNSIEPLTLFMYNGAIMRYAYVKVAPGDLQSSFETVKQSWETIEPDREFIGSFLDENIDRTLQKERYMTTMISSGSILAIVLSCIGLFAISLLVVAQRKKEIGIRKVIGASVSTITVLLTKDFLKLVGIAFLIAAPLAYYFAGQWLQNYIYRMELNIWIFAVAGIIALVIAVATISVRTIAAALANPVDSLKTE
ncbi:ABC transporter permease [Nonlabens agnitus]|uniref:ABC transporter permease n=1 Tax=Nonlabens agnitus TaxID=870484 RepID=A0A2S9WRZ2_9FLAO|nr:ABC transporter permease [Nonlabens agnitus]PRP66250.1 ABC transporter permease [Nonlabens agnitus]